MAESGALLGALLLLLVGLASVTWPYKLARWSEILDAIGRKPAGRVEPADWKVWMNRAGGAILATIGFLFVLASLLQ